LLYYALRRCRSGPGAVDFGCDRQTYDGHDGTDFAISDMEAVKSGVPVLTASAGVVKRTRDGVPDRLVKDKMQEASLKTMECGNGVLIDHGRGWETQYCHLRKGSVIVRPGQKVDKGAPLGMVGASGLASFPHVHFTVRHEGNALDPFVGRSGLGGCQVPRHPLWENPLEYAPTGLIRAGFASRPPTQKELWRGEFRAVQMSESRLPALVFWVHVFGVLHSEKERFILIAPDKKMIADREKPIAINSKSWLGFIGKKNTADAPLPRGTWHGIYKLTRGGHTLIDVERTFVVD